MNAWSCIELLVPSVWGRNWADSSYKEDKRPSNGNGYRGCIEKNISNTMGRKFSLSKSQYMYIHNFYQTLYVHVHNLNMENEHPLTCRLTPTSSRISIPSSSSLYTLLTGYKEQYTRTRTCKETWHENNKAP